MRNSFCIIFLFLFSCTTVQQAVILDKPVKFRIEKFGEVVDGDNSYTAEILHSGSEYEFYVTYRGVSVYRYVLPNNKLQLLYEMENAFKDIRAKKSAFNYYRITVTADKSKRHYKVNTDLIANFITGLKPKVTIL